MKAALGIISLIAGLAIGYAVLSLQTKSVIETKPLTQVNLVAVRSNLLYLARSEQLYLATNGSYGTLEELHRAGTISLDPENNHGGYVFASDIDGAIHFLITAIPADSSREDLPTLAIDETMQVSP